MAKYQLVFYCPTEDSEKCKQACFAAGGGLYEKYADACFESAGIGQFRPLPSANPHIGEAGGPLEKVDEMRIEMMVHGDIEVIRGTVKALKEAHPYEEVAYSVMEMLDI